VKFIDANSIPNSECATPGVQYVSTCGGWRVTTSNMWTPPTATGPAEWLVWSHDRNGRVGRRMQWARFITAEQAAAAAALCEAVTLSPMGRAVTSAQDMARTLRDGMTDRLRSVGTLGIFTGMRLAHAAAEGLRDFARRQSGAEG
jgi:hypothetical protein